MKRDFENHLLSMLTGLSDTHTLPSRSTF